MLSELRNMPFQILVGGIPTIGSHCDGNMTASIQATSTKHLPWSTLANAFDGITLITLLPPSTYQSNLVSPSVKTRKSEDRLISTTPINKKMMLAATKNPSEKLEKTANLLLLPSMYSVSNGIKTDSVLMTTKNPTTRMVSFVFRLQICFNISSKPLKFQPKTCQQYFFSADKPTIRKMRKLLWHSSPLRIRSIETYT